MRRCFRCQAKTRGYGKRSIGHLCYRCYTQDTKKRSLRIMRRVARRQSTTTILAKSGLRKINELLKKGRL